MDATDISSALSILRKYDPDCPHAEGFIFHKVYAYSVFTEWWQGDLLVGLYELMPGKPVIGHRLCDLCCSHSVAPIGARKTAKGSDQRHRRRVSRVRRVTCPGLTAWRGGGRIGGTVWYLDCELAEGYEDLASGPEPKAG